MLKLSEMLLKSNSLIFGKEQSLTVYTFLIGSNVKIHDISVGIVIAVHNVALAGTEHRLALNVYPCGIEQTFSTVRTRILTDYPLCLRINGYNVANLNVKREADKLPLALVEFHAHIDILSSHLTIYQKTGRINLGSVPIIIIPAVVVMILGVWRRNEVEIIDI